MTPREQFEKETEIISGLRSYVSTPENWKDYKQFGYDECELLLSMLESRLASRQKQADGVEAVEFVHWLSIKGWRPLKGTDKCYKDQATEYTTELYTKFKEAGK